MEVSYVFFEYPDLDALVMRDDGYEGVVGRSHMLRVGFCIL